MLWPLVFIRFLLTSSVRTQESMAPLQELQCRMLAHGRCEEQMISDGCGCPVQRPPPYRPELKDGSLNVGWEDALDESTAITYSFEKEWVGVAPRLHEVYGPAGPHCERLWDGLDVTKREQFMSLFWTKVEKSNATDDVLEKYFDPLDNPCCLKAKERDHNWLPLKKSDIAPAGISDFIDYDAGPWEVKAASFYYDLGTMAADVWETLQYLDVPKPERNISGAFPAERRIQVHVVAPLRRGGDGPPATNPALHRAFRLIQLYYSDYTFLRLGFPSGPNGAECSGFGGSFKCDVFTDFYNDVIETYDADLAWKDTHTAPVDGNKNKIVGIRTSETYDGAPIHCPDGDDCSKPYRLGFEIRKSASFSEAVQVADAIARAIHSMKADGSAQVGIRQERSIHIEDVRTFAQYRMKLRTQPFCLQDFERRAQSAVWWTTIRNLAVYLYRDVGRKDIPSKQMTGRLTRELANMLALLLCSDWTKLVHTSVPPPDYVHRALEAIHELGESAPKLAMDGFRTTVAEYAYVLSESF